MVKDVEYMQKRLQLRDYYFRELIPQEYTTEQLQSLHVEFDEVDSAWLDDPEAEIEKLCKFTENSFRQYFTSQDIDYDSLDDESFSDLVDDLIKKARKLP